MSGSERPARAQAEPATVDGTQSIDETRVQEIAQALGEPNVELLVKVTSALGIDAVETLYRRTLEVEAGGGLLTVRGDRRRTAGGVLFFLARETMNAEEQLQIFGNPRSPEAPPKADPPTLQQALTLLYATAKLSADKKGPAIVKTTVIGRPKQIKKMDTCTLVVLGQKKPTTLPSGLPPYPDVSQATIAVFISKKHWNRVEAALKADPKDELIIEGYPVNDPKSQLTGVWAQSCTTKGLQRAKREAQKAEGS